MQQGGGVIQPQVQAASEQEQPAEQEEPVAKKNESLASLLRRHPYSLLVRARGFAKALKKAKGQGGRHEVALARRDRQIKERDKKIASLELQLRGGQAFSEADVQMVWSVRRINDAMKDVVLCLLRG